MEQALARAGIDPGEVDYVEAHGTGTALGDSIEMRALESVYSQGRNAERPLLVGSVKTNIGHLEWASGMASLIKVVMAMAKGVIPSQLHFQDPNPELDWEDAKVRIASEITYWPLHPDKLPLAAINAFGLSGANAHVVVQGYGGQFDADGATEGTGWTAGSSQPVAAALPVPNAGLTLEGDDFRGRGARLLPLSGKSPAALRDSAARFLSWLDEQGAALSPESAGRESLLADLAWTAGVGRSHFNHRAGVVFRDGETLRQGLIAVAQVEPGDAESAAPVTPRTAFVYAGGLEAWAGMGEGLYRAEPVVRTILDRCDQLMREEQGYSLLDVILGRGERPGDVNGHSWKLPAVYALQGAVTALWESVGVAPAAVLGQSVGELAAAQAAGVISLEDGLRLAATVTNPDAALPRVAMMPPSTVWVSGVTGRVGAVVRRIGHRALAALGRRKRPDARGRWRAGPDGGGPGY